MRLIAIAVASAVASMAAVGVATGAIPGGDGTINACHAKVANVRYLRLIDKQAGESCKSSEKQLTWNQKGPKGDPGAKGPKGDPGPQGPKGDPGLGSLTPRAVAESAPPGQVTQVGAHCQPGERVTGGGFVLPESGADLRVINSSASQDMTTWVVEVLNNSGQDQVVLAQAVCAS